MGNEIIKFTPDYLNQTKAIFYPESTDYENEVQWMKESVKILTWENNAEEMSRKYNDLVNKYNMHELSEYVVYEVWENNIAHLMFFINPQRQTARIFNAPEKKMFIESEINQVE